MLVTILLVLSISITLVVTALVGLAVWQAALLLIGSFLGLIIVYVLLAFCTCFLVRDMEKPIERAKPICRFAATSVFGLVCSLCRVNLRVWGREKLPGKAENFLLVCNHRSAFDPVVIMSALAKHRVAAIAKPSVMKLPIIGRIAYGFGCLGIDRDNDRNALKTILTAANYLKKGICNVLIFPEGTRNRSGELLEFQAGSYKIAQRAGASLVIASIYGSEDITRRAPFRSSRVDLRILEVLPPEKVKEMNTQELAEYSRKLIAESIGEVEA